MQKNSPTDINNDVCFFPFTLCCWLIFLLLIVFTFQEELQYERLFASSINCSLICWLRIHMVLLVCWKMTSRGFEFPKLSINVIYTNIDSVLKYFVCGLNVHFNLLTITKFFFCILHVSRWLWQMRHVVFFTFDVFLTTMCFMWMHLLWTMHKLCNDDFNYQALWEDDNSRVKNIHIQEMNTIWNKFQIFWNLNEPKIPNKLNSIEKADFIIMNHYEYSQIKMTNLTHSPLNLESKWD